VHFNTLIITIVILAQVTKTVKEKTIQLEGTKKEVVTPKIKYTSSNTTAVNITFEQIYCNNLKICKVYT